jgi:hypothetical protein
MYLRRTPVVLLQMVVIMIGRMADGIVIVLPQFERLKRSQRLKAKVRVCTTPIVLQPEPRGQLLCVAVIPVMGHISIGIMTASVVSDQQRRQDNAGCSRFTGRNG